MNALVHQGEPAVTASDLAEAGFSDEQIEALETLRANYPYIEFFDSRKELQRLRFMKWMIGRKRTAR